MKTKLSAAARDRVRRRVRGLASGLKPRGEGWTRLLSEGLMGLSVEGGKLTFEMREVVRGLSRGELRLLAGVPGRLARASASMVLIGVGKCISAAQTAAGVEPLGRALSEFEARVLRQVFGASLDLERPRIKEGPAGLASLVTDRPFVHGDVLYLHRNRLSSRLLVHEAVHWWQNQNGGPDYMLLSLLSQAWGAGYEWWPDVPGRPWSELEVEQQASFIEHAHAAGASRGGAWWVNGTDLQDYLQDALRELRAGRGAP